MWAFLVKILITYFIYAQKIQKIQNKSRSSSFDQAVPCAIIKDDMIVAFLIEILIPENSE